MQEYLIQDPARRLHRGDFRPQRGRIPVKRVSEILWQAHNEPPCDHDSWSLLARRDDLLMIVWHQLPLQTGTTQRCDEEMRCLRDRAMPLSS
jgi:hypothetical protein